VARGRTRRFLITGLAALLPTLLTIYLLYIVVVWIHENIGSKVNRLLSYLGSDIVKHRWTIFVGDAVAFLVLLGLVWFVGFLLATYFGRMAFRRLDHAFRRIPLIRVVYPALKQVTDFFLAERAIPFSRVVAAEYPRRGIYSIGFLTGDGLSTITTPHGERLISVFIPNSPAPLTGFTIFVRRSEVISVNLSVDEAIKLIVSGGVVVPDREQLETPLPLLLGNGSDAEKVKPDEAAGSTEPGSED